MALSKPVNPEHEMSSDSDFEEPSIKRFRELSDEQLSDIQEDLDPKNTVKSDAKCECILVAYLKQLQMSEIYWEYENSDLDKLLGKFWFAARNQKGDYYSVSSLKHIRYALKRILFKKKKIDILSHPDYADSRLKFNDACRELKIKGYGSVKHTPEIKPHGKHLHF